MPVEKERELRAEARHLASSGKLNKRKRYKTMKEAENAYVWGTMRTIEERHRAKGGRPGKYMHNI